MLPATASDGRRQNLAVNPVDEEASIIDRRLWVNDIELLDRRQVERGLAAVGGNIGNLAIGNGRVLMEDVESLRTTDVKAFQNGIQRS